MLPSGALRPVPGSPPTSPVHLIALRKLSWGHPRSLGPSRPAHSEQSSPRAPALLPSRVPLPRWRIVALLKGPRCAKHIVGKEEFAIRRHHHHLDLIGQLFGNDLVDQQRI